MIEKRRRAEREILLKKSRAGREREREEREGRGGGGGREREKLGKPDPSNLQEDLCPSSEC